MRGAGAAAAGGILGKGGVRSGERNEPDWEEELLHARENAARDFAGKHLPKDRPALISRQSCAGSERECGATRRKKRVGALPIAWQNPPMNDYERIARVIRFLDENHAAQPDLATLAAEVGLSAFHFHRLFVRWAGVTPKDFLQCLTLEKIRERLRAGASVLDAVLRADFPARAGCMIFA